MIVPGMLVCSSFLISVCMFIVSKALLISSATVIVRAGGAIWLNPFATVLFSVCSVVFCTRVAWVCLVCLLLCKEEGSSCPCPAIVRLTFTSLIFINDAQTLLAGFSEHSLQEIPK